MRKNILLAPLAALLTMSPLSAQEPPKQEFPSPNAIVDAAPASDWKAIAASDLLVMDLAPDAKGDTRRVIIQLMPPPFSQGWIGNIRKLAAAKFWDGTSINRVQDNYVVQWGDAGYDNPESGEVEQKALPEGLVEVPESEYTTPTLPDFAGPIGFEGATERQIAFIKTAMSIARLHMGHLDIFGKDRDPDQDVNNFVMARMADRYSDINSFAEGWPVGGKRDDETLNTKFWPVHCYGAVGVGRNLSPNTGSGAELYTVIGHAPRHLDRNIAVVGRIIEGIDHLSSLPRGKGKLGFYADASKRVPIQSIRIATDMPEAEQPRFEYLSTESKPFARYADARANRRDPFFIKPAGGADICNIPVPVRRVKAEE
ncbi:peptidylprolyl isomerase [Parasphingorhabdus cellanae]|uniref:Peptidylprolyl isomerase n=1 Tax=Parasphingorhabdus cellanae TaxID=2806553 RepID=A0ABX7T1Z5_9SPHN|nr:peptidylprolyl isomerase [Parasphingorhabdus cellanae]QTD54802.1 peptidylprolyl isomerase [Parasphingorhabdus cellanae]